MPTRAAKPIRETYAYRWSRLVQHHPWPSSIVGTVILVVLALPVLGMRLGFSDESNFEEDTTTRQAYDLLADGFGPGFNGPFFLMVTRCDEEADPRGARAITADVAADPGVAFVTPADAQTIARPDLTAVPLEGHARRRPPQDAETTYCSSTDSATTCSSSGEGDARRQHRRHRFQPPATVDFSGYLSASACRSSSAPCSSCRSCC